MRLALHEGNGDALAVLNAYGEVQAQNRSLWTEPAWRSNKSLAMG